MTARYYIYRNLRTKGFSVRHRGKVIAHLNEPAYVSNVDFKVNESSRQRVIREKQKNVHAFIICENFCMVPQVTVDEINKVTYNPYTDSTFMCNDKPITSVDALYLVQGKCYRI